MIIRSVKFNVTTLILTTVMGLIVVYLYALLAFFFVDDTFFKPDIGNSFGENQCVSVAQCFMTVLALVEVVD